MSDVKKNIPGPDDTITGISLAEEECDTATIIQSHRITSSSVKENYGSVPFDFNCRQSCVRDCSCVSHCSWIVA